MWDLWEGLDAIDCFHCGSEFVYQLLGGNSRTSGKRAKVRFPYLEFATESAKPARKDAIRLVYSGRMVPHKGPQIFARAVKNIEGVPIHVFGDGPLMADVQKVLANKTNAVLHGWKSQSEIQEHFGLGAVVVLPYLAHETFCYAAVEAMAKGCCVVASTRGAIPELIQNGKNGILIQDPTPQNFNTVICHLLRDPDQIFELGRAAITIAQELPTQSVHANEMIQLYKKLQT